MSTTASTPSAASAASAEPPPPSGSFAVVVGKAPPGDGRSFPLGQASIKAKKGRVFRSGLVLDADGDGTDDLLAWSELSAGSKGELSFVHGGGADPSDTVLAKLPSELDIEHCSHDAVVSRIGNAVIAVKVSADCQDPARHEQWIAIVRLDLAVAQGGPKPPENRLELRVTDPLAADPRAEDRDKDGREDLVFVSYPVGEKSDDRLQASLVLWDRPAGYAWDPSEPEASLGKLGQGLLARAVAKKPDTIARAESALGFAAALCNDFGAGRVRSTAGVPKCQDSRVVGDALHAAALSAFAGSDLARAAGAADLIAALKIDGGRSTQLDASMAKKMKKVEAVAQRRPTAKPSKSSVLSPLAFDDSGALLIATDSGVTKVDLVAGDETNSDVAPWPRALVWGDGDGKIEITAAAARCAPSATFLQFAAKGSSSEIELPLLGSLLPKATLKDKCEKKNVTLTPLSVDSQGAVVALRGETFRLAFGDTGLTAARTTFDASTAMARGMSRSPDGKIAIFPLARSVLVLKPGAAERWRGNDTHDLKACVVNNAGDRVACLSGADAVVLGPKK